MVPKTTCKIQFDPAKIVAITDSREQIPFDLSPLATAIGTLDTGDYSVEGLESVVAIERKSLGDLVACCGRERARFQRELNRLRGYPVSAVIVETTWTAIESGTWKRPQQKVTPNHVLGSLTSWIAQGHTIILAPRPMAQQICRSVLQHAARHQFERAKALLEGVA